MATLMQQPSWRSFLTVEEPVAEARLAAMGFDVRRLRFYAWLVATGREPLVEPDTALCVPRREHPPVTH